MTAIVPRFVDQRKELSMSKTYDWLGKRVDTLVDKIVWRIFVIVVVPLAVAAAVWLFGAKPISIWLAVLVTAVTVHTVAVLAIAKQRQDLCQAIDSAFSVGGADFKIIKATWGTPNNYFTVTDKIRKVTAGNELHFDKDKNTLFGDPAPNDPTKKLKLWYIAVKEFHEQEKVHLP